jgi:hypothetical protein
MTFAVLEPSVMTISEQQWSDEQRRDDFIEHLNMVMNCIDDNEAIALAWSESIDELIWSAPQRPPWRQDRDWAIPLIPIIYNKITANSDYIDIDQSSTTCDITPDINSDNADLLLAFKQILAYLHGHCDKILIPMGLANPPPYKLTFTVDHESMNPAPHLLSNEQDFLNQIDVADCYWPQNSADTEKLGLGLTILLAREYNTTTPPMDFTFSNNFMRKLVATNNDRKRILAAIAKRLSMNTAEAGRDGSLHDENLTGQDNVRRFRVTQRPTSKRMHYTFKDGMIEFTMFYDAGEHDDGL